MGFSGGGSNVLLPHTHDGTVTQDGGPLDFNNITQSQSAAGEVFFSDGAHLQQLAYPGVPAGETLTAAAASTAPSWVAAAAPTSVWTELANETVSGGSANLTASWLGTYQILQIFVYSDSVGATPSGIRWNGDNAANYNGVHSTGSWSGERSTDYTNASTTDFVWSNITVYNLASQMKLINVSSTLSGGGAGSAPAFYQSWNMWTNSVDSIQNCQLVERNPGTLKNFNNDSHLLILGAN